MQIKFHPVFTLFFLILAACGGATDKMATPDKGEPDVYTDGIETIQNPDMLKATIDFKPGSTKLDTQQLQKIANYNATLNTLNINTMELGVLTDADDNTEALSKQRADVVREALLNLGDDSRSIANTSDTTTSTTPSTQANSIEITAIADKKMSDCQEQGLKDDYSSKPTRRLFDCVSVFYGTNRLRQSNLQNPYGPAPIPADDNIKLGKIIVTLPSKHKPGAKVKKLDEDEEYPTQKERGKFFTVWDWQDEDELTDEAFKLLARHQIKETGPYKNQAFVFIHGFNVNFRNAAFRTAQIKADIEFDGPAFLFSWPSNGSTSQYLSDQDDADLSARRLMEYLQMIRTGVGSGTKIHIIAHSMGNRVFAQTLRNMKDLPPDQQVDFDVAVFASADLSARLFEEWVVNTVTETTDSGKAAINRAMIYSTKDDKALGFSSFLRQSGEIPFERVGLIKNDTPSIFGAPFETIDLTNIKSNILTFSKLQVNNKFSTNHSKYVESLPTVCHIGQIFRGGDITKSNDTGNIARQEIDGKTYWTMEKQNALAKRCVWE